MCGALQLAKSVLEGILDFVHSLPGVAGGLFYASPGPKPAVSGHAASAFLGCALPRLGLMPDLLDNAHGVRFSRLFQKLR